MGIQVTVRYFAGAQAAAGRPEELVELPGVVTVADLSARLAERHGPDLERVLQAASFLVDEVVAGADRRVNAGSSVDVLPPFAGG